MSSMTFFPANRAIRLLDRSMPKGLGNAFYWYVFIDEVSRKRVASCVEKQLKNGQKQNYTEKR
jgi:hypothetical protein